LLIFCFAILTFFSKLANLLALNLDIALQKADSHIIQVQIPTAPLEVNLEVKGSTHRYSNPFCQPFSIPSNTFQTQLKIADVHSLNLLLLSSSLYLFQLENQLNKALKGDWISSTANQVALPAILPALFKEFKELTKWFLLG
jgi:hypothetical protein